MGFALVGIQERIKEREKRNGDDQEILKIFESEKKPQNTDF